MKIRNISLINIMGILDQYSEYKLPQKISYAITRNILNLTSDMQCYSKSLKKIIEGYNEYLIKNENGEYLLNQLGIPDIKKDQYENYMKDISELLNIEIDVDIYNIEISDFDYVDCGKYDLLSASDILKLQSILCINEKGDSNEKDD